MLDDESDAPDGQEECKDHKPHPVQIPQGHLTVCADEYIALDRGSNALVLDRSSRARGVGRRRTDKGSPWPCWMPGRAI
jgi:hypothetical protein